MSTKERAEGLITVVRSSRACVGKPWQLEKGQNGNARRRTPWLMSVGTACAPYRHVQCGPRSQAGEARRLGNHTDVEAPAAAEHAVLARHLRGTRGLQAQQLHLSADYII